MGAAGLGIGSAGAGGGGGAWRGGSSRSSPGDVSSLVSNEKVVVQKREAYGDKFYRQVILNSDSVFFFLLKLRFLFVVLVKFRFWLFFQSWRSDFGLLLSLQFRWC